MTDQYLRELYYNSDVSYTGIQSLWHKIKEDKKKIKYNELKEWLKEQEVYSLHKPAKKNFRTERLL